jgi:hypothetical protein
MKILPHMSKAVVLLHEDGKTFEMAPFQVFQAWEGQTIIRIGRNTFFFDKDGKFDGTECAVAGLEFDSPEARMIQQAFDLQGEYKGLAPETPYFEPGSPGYAHETRAWPTAKAEAPGHGYIAVPKPRTEH